MRTLLVLATLSFAPALTAQNWVANGDFAAGLAPWIETGYSWNPGVEVFDVTGLGAQSCYRCGHGGQVSPGPYPPNSIKQSLLVIPGVPLEFSMDLCVQNGGSNADAGTFWIEIGGTEIARSDFGAYPPNAFLRGTVSTQFVHPTGGTLDLEIFFSRDYLGTPTTPHARVTNISLQITTGPTFTFDGTRELGATRAIGMVGEPNRLAGTFLSFTRTTGLQIPGIGGTFFLDPANHALFFWSILPGSGVHTQPFAIPNDPNLLTLVAWVQGVQLSGGTTPTLGFDHFLQFNQ